MANLQRILLVFIALLCISKSNIFSQQTDLYSQQTDVSMLKIYAMDLEELMNSKVTIATKSEQLANESPSSVSVVTAEEIKHMGARELEDVMQLIPGFELAKRFTGEYGLGVRGLKDSRTTSKLLIMIDGNPYNQIFYGNSFGSGYDINLDAIERIEIIRGPGSALYGRNAFSGVINIITKRAYKNDMSFVSGSVGSRNEKSASVLCAYREGNAKVAVAARTLYNGIANSKAYEYGKLEDWNVYAKIANVSANIDYGKLSFSGMYSDLENGGYLSQTFLLDKKGYYSLAYNAEVSPKLTLNTVAFGHNGFYTENIEQIRPGVDSSMLLGFYIKPVVSEYLYGFESNMRYKLGVKNELLFGVQSDFHGVYQVDLYSNFNFATNLAIPGLGRSNVALYKPGWFVNNGHDYQNLAFYVQHAWYPLRVVSITLGGRYDIDSQIGGQFNPRLGIVMEPFKNMNVKLLYGRAYRAPSPSEQYQTLGYVFGNQNLKPEVMNTFEIALSYRYEKMSNALSFFRNEISDIIFALANNSVDPSNTTNNIGKNISQGIEYECKTVVFDNMYAFFNYSFTVSENATSMQGRDSVYAHADVAPHKFNVGVNYLLLKYLNCNVNAFYRSKMNKYLAPDPSNTNPDVVKLVEVGDKMGNYLILNATFRVENLVRNHLSINFSVHNMLDTEYFSQDNERFHQPAQPGRQFIAGAVYAF